MDALRVGLVQMRHGDELEDNLTRAAEHVAAAAADGARLVLLPEYFFATFGRPPPEAAAHAARIRRFYEETSRAHEVAVAGNLIEPGAEGPSNVGVVYERGARVLDQPKVHPMPREVESGVVGGTHFAAADLGGGVRAGLLVCADILFPEAAALLALQRAEVVLNPVMSPFREEADDERAAREAVYVARAWDARAFVLKACGWRRPEAAPAAASGPPAVAGRSLVAAPWGVVAHYGDTFADERIVVDLDLRRLRAFRTDQERFPPRNPRAYSALTTWD